MTTTTAHKRLDEIETYLTPKEWAIRLADEARKYPGALAYAKSLAKLPLDELPVRRPYFAFEEQAGERHPGHNPEDNRARHRLKEALWNEFHTLKLLLWWVNMAMRRKVESIGSQAALRLSALHALILQDALAQTARQTAALLTKRKQSGAKPEREAVLKQLAAFTEVDICETPSGPVPPEDDSNRYPSPLAEWNHELTALLKDFFAHHAAVELVQGRHFNGHPILFRDLESELTETARTIESAVATANEYLKCRAGLLKAEPSQAGREDKLAVAIESIKASANGQRAAAIAEQWLHDASFEATETDEEQWERWREEHAGEG
jgi:hypothetical protein